jgi:plastocyanin
MNGAGPGGGTGGGTGPLRIEDDTEKMLALLRQLVENTGGLAERSGPGGTDVTIEGQTAASRVGTIEPANLLVVETADLEDANDDGTITVEPGSTETFVQFRGQPHNVLAGGAVDRADVRYNLEADGSTTVGGTTNSPLGSINEPFSFVATLGGAPGVERRSAYKAFLSEGADAPVRLAGRLFVELI